MKITQTKEKIFNRLSFKSLDNQFKQEVERGLNCSPFESKLLVETVKEIYFPYFHHPDNIQSGQIRIQAISEDEPAGKPLKHCFFKTVTLTLDKGKEDLEIRKERGIEELRRHRLLRMCQEALAQGALLTVEDLAYRIFNVGYRTILRDISELRKKDITVALRSSQKDIGRTITHKKQIIKLWLSGFEYSEIALRTHHSLEAIERYVNLFKRALALREGGYPAVSVSFLLKSSLRLIREYWKVFDVLKEEEKILPLREKEIRDFLKKTDIRELERKII